MSPEAAALVGAVIGTTGAVIVATLSFVGSLVVNERSQAAERKRLEVQFAESVKKEQRDRASQARRQRLQPALDLLSSFEQILGAQLESSAVDALRDQGEKDFGPFDDAVWEKVKSEALTINPPAYATVIGEYLPKIRAIPLPDLVTELQYLIAIATSMPSIPKMTTEKRRVFLERIRSARNTIDSEIIRGDWP